MGQSGGPQRVGRDSVSELIRRTILGFSQLSFSAGHVSLEYLNYSESFKLDGSNKLK